MKEIWKEVALQILVSVLLGTVVTLAIIGLGFLLGAVPDGEI